MTYSHIVTGDSKTTALPVVRHITPADLWNSLKRGVDDFAAMPSHALFLCVIYPIIGILLVAVTFGYAALPLAFPIAAGFALIGPIAAIGLYELSRRREAGLDSSASHAFDVLHSPSLGAIVVLSLMLMAIFLVWLSVAQAIYIIPGITLVGVLVAAAAIAGAGTRGRSTQVGEGHRPAARRALLPVAGVGSARSRLDRMARVHHDPGRTAVAGRPAPIAARLDCGTGRPGAPILIGTLRACSVTA